MKVKPCFLFYPSLFLFPSLSLRPSSLFFLFAYPRFIYDIQSCYHHIPREEFRQNSKNRKDWDFEGERERERKSKKEGEIKIVTKGESNEAKEKLNQQTHFAKEETKREIGIGNSV